MTLHIKHLLFDLDGTLSDPAEGVLNSLRYSAKKLGLEEKQQLELKNCIGPPLHEIFAEQYGLTGEEINQATTVFREYYGKRGLMENSIYEGIPAMLGRLHKQGYKLYLATSKMEHFGKHAA